MEDKIFEKKIYIFRGIYNSILMESKTIIFKMYVCIYVHLCTFISKTALTLKSLNLFTLVFHVDKVAGASSKVM